MIQVNLLPEELRPVKRTPIPYIISILILLGVIAGIFYMYQNTGAQIATHRANAAQANSEFALLEDVVNEHAEMVELKRTLSLKIATIDEIVSGRIIWSKQLFNLSKVLPDNVWIGDVEVATVRRRQTVMVLDPNTKQRVPKEEIVPRKVLLVNGYVIAGDDGDDVQPLVEAVETNEEFTSMFQLVPFRFEDTEFGGFPVKRFELEFDVLGDAGDAS